MQNIRSLRVYTTVTESSEKSGMLSEKLDKCQSTVEICKYYAQRYECVPSDTVWMTGSITSGISSIIYLIYCSVFVFRYHKHFRFDQNLECSLSRLKLSLYYAECNMLPVIFDSGMIVVLISVYSYA